MEKPIQTVTAERIRDAAAALFAGRGCNGASLGQRDRPRRRAVPRAHLRCGPSRSTSSKSMEHYPWSAATTDRWAWFLRSTSCGPSATSTRA